MPPSRAPTPGLTPEEIRHIMGNKDLLHDKIRERNIKPPRITCALSSHQFLIDTRRGTCFALLSELVRYKSCARRPSVDQLNLFLIEAVERL